MRTQALLLGLVLFSVSSMFVIIATADDHKSSTAKWAYKNKGITVVRGNTFINKETIKGLKASMVNVDGRKIIFEKNRMYNRGKIIGREQATMLNLKQNKREQSRKTIKSRSNTFSNSGRIQGVGR